MRKVFIDNPYIAVIYNCFKLGDQFILDNDSTSSCNEPSCIECLEDETSHRNSIFYNKNRLSMAIDDNDRLEQDHREDRF